METEHCDLLLQDVDVVSPGSPVRRGAAVAVRAGEIVAVIDVDEFGQWSAEQCIDGRGGICMPGFANVHNHTPLMAVRGMVEDLGFAPAYTPGVPQGHWLGDEETYLLARLGLAEMLAQGCTSVVDFYARPAALARAMHESGLRGFVGGRVMDADTDALAAGRFEVDTELGERTLADNVELLESWDGVGRVRCVLGPHAADTCSGELLARVGALAQAHGCGVHTHLAQSRLEVEHVAARDGKRSLDLLDAAGLLGPRTIAAHCIHLNDGEIARLAQSGTRVAHVPGGNATGGAIAPVMDLVEAGIHLTLCTDSKSADMFEAMRMAIRVARIRADGEFVLNAATVFDWATVGGARALGLEGLTGRVEVGHRADLVLLDHRAPNLRPVVDGVGIIVHSGAGPNVRTVVCDGEVLVDDGTPTRIDLDEVIASGQAVADRLWQKVRADA